jgi:hypothetical protein
VRIEKALAISLAIHLLLTGAYAINLGIKRCSRNTADQAVFAELVPPPAPDTAHRSPDLLAEKTEAAAARENPAEAPPETGMPAAEAADPAVVPEAPPAASPPAAEPVAALPEPATEPTPAGATPTSTTSTASGDPAPDAAPDNVATAAAPPALDPEMLDRVRMHHVALVSTDAFYRLVPGELSRIVNDTLAGGALMSQGDALVHMDVTPSGQVGDAHVQANSRALLNRLEQIDWRAALPPRPLAACNAIHLRVSVEGNDIRVRIELL